ncbi:MAG: alkyl hydroperoxide reductase [Blastopirellula sp.]|nr:alkyl hydroperoxide reductase [Blastopirellula sp.]
MEFRIPAKIIVGFTLIACASCLSAAADDTKKPTDPGKAASKPQDSADENKADDAEQKAEDAEQKPDDKEVRAGHSYHGEYLNEGPRQKAYIMGGTGAVDLPVTSSSEQAKAFVAQGLGAIYGFWTLEAERSFRQAAALDPDCAMAYWGAALATKGNEKRAKGFIAEAVKRKDKVSEHERMYIDALDKYFKADASKKKERAEAYSKALEAIALQYPDDVEAKALLALQLYLNNRSGSPIVSYLSVDGVLDKVFAKQPMHSAHHFRIHLWDYKKPEKALASAALCGQSSPSIAHMWHMPGHIFSRLKRYEDAAWQQEASARVDHAHMMRDSVLPDQIHNFAHNNEWLIRNLNYVGRVQDAVDLAKNMIELPRHPKYNTLARRGSTNYGRMRLFETLSRYERWTELIDLCDTPYLEPTDNEKEQVKRLRHLGIAYFKVGDAGAGESVLTQLQDRLEKKQKQRDAAADAAVKKETEKVVDAKVIEKVRQQAIEKAKSDGIEDESEQQTRAQQAEDKSRKEQVGKKKKEIDKARNEARKPFDSAIGDLTRAIAGVESAQAEAQSDYSQALTLAKKAGRNVGTLQRAKIQFLAGQQKSALEEVKKEVDRHKGEVYPLAMQVDLLWQAGKKKEARQQFQRLRDTSSSIDKSSPVFSRLTKIAVELGHTEDWVQPAKPRKDVGKRPDLDTLGPFRWSPSPAPSWELPDANKNCVALSAYQGKPVVVIFYLGFGCLHCVEQLHAFNPMYEAYQKAGIDMVAIGTDDLETLQLSIEGLADSEPKKEIQFPLLSDASLDSFKAYRAYDDFEEQPLHGTFLIDANGQVRWQDISYEPFMDAKFLLKESQRLLANTPGDATPPTTDSQAAGD